MKTTFKIFMLAIFLIVNESEQLYAQFTPSTNADVIYSDKVVPSIVNNDILDDGSTTFRVTAFTDWSGSANAGIVWQVTNGTLVTGD